MKRIAKNCEKRYPVSFFAGRSCCMVLFVIALVYSQQAFTQNIVQAEYFIDADPGYGAASPIAISPAPNLDNLNFSIPVSGVQEGMHTLYIRVKDGLGKWSLTSNRPFLKLNLVSPPDISRLEYFIDTDPGVGSGVSVTVTPGINLNNIVANIDDSSLAVGVHTLYFRARDASGKWSLASNRPFYKFDLHIRPDISEAEYFIDADPGVGLATALPVTASPDITNLVFPIDITCYTPGDHELYTRSRDALGKWSLTNAGQFTVLPRAIARPQITVTGSTTFCDGGSVTFTAPSGPARSFQWHRNEIPIVNATNPVYSATESGIYYSTINHGGVCTDTTNKVGVVVKTLPVPTITGAAVVCAGPAGVVYTTETGMHGYTWTVPSGGTILTGNGTSTLIVAWNSAGSQVVRVNYTNADGCSAPSPTDHPVNVFPQMVAGSITGNQTICSGTVPALLTSVPPAGGAVPYTYRWQSSPNNSIFTDIPGATNFNFQPGVLTATTYYRQVQSCAGSNCSVNTNVVAVTVNPVVPVSVNVGVSANPVCEGVAVTFTAAPVNGGSNPGYQWKINNVLTGSTGNSLNYIPVNGDIVTCQLTSNALCVSGNPATSSPVSMAVNPFLPVSISIGAFANPVCAGNVVTFTATATNGGVSPVYTWKKNNTNIGTNNPVLTYTPGNGDSITCYLHSSLVCNSGNPAISNQVIVSVNQVLPVSVSIAASVNPVCAGIPVTYLATPVNGGTTPSFHWKRNGISVGSDNSIYSDIPVNGEVITCELTSGEGCTSGNPASNQITMSVNPLLTPDVSIVGSANYVCSGTPVTYTATPVNAGSAPSFEWNVNGSSAGSNSSTFVYVPLNGDVITCLVTSNDACAIGNPAVSNPITTTVNNLFPVSVSVSASANPACAGAIVTFTALPVNCGISPSFQWKMNGFVVGTSVTFQYSPVNGDDITCVMTSSELCTTGNPATSSPLTMTVNQVLPVSVSIAASDNPVCAGTSVTYTATPVNSGSFPAFQWRRNGINIGSNSHLFSYIPVDGDVITCKMTSNAACTSGNPAVSNPVTMIVNSGLPVSVSIVASANPVCAGTTVTFTAIPVNGGISPTFQWKKNGINAGTNSSTFSYVPADGDIVKCILTSNLGCSSGNPSTSNAVSMLVNPVVPVSVSVTPSINPACIGWPISFTAHPVNGGSSPTFHWNCFGVDFPETDSVVNIEFADYVNTAICTMTSSALCPSAAQVTSTVTVEGIDIPVRLVLITASANPVCMGTSVTFTASYNGGGLTPFLQWKKNGMNVGTNSPVFSCIPENGDVFICEMTSSYPCLAMGPQYSSPPITMTVLVNPAAAGPITGSTTLSAGLSTNIHYNISPVPGATSYQWTLPQDWNIVSGEGTPSITVSLPPTSISGIVTVQGSAGTCTGTASSLAVTVTPATNLNISSNVGGMSGCYNASNDIILTNNFVSSGTSLTLIAGNSITINSFTFSGADIGFKVFAGGYFDAHITTNGTYCGMPLPPLPGNPAILPEDVETVLAGSSLFNVYPDPTTGIFTLELKDDPQGLSGCNVEIYGMHGEMVMNENLTGGRKHNLSLEGRSAGIYLIRVGNGVKSGSLRIIKQ